MNIPLPDQLYLGYVVSQLTNETMRSQRTYPSPDKRGRNAKMDVVVPSDFQRLDEWLADFDVVLTKHDYAAAKAAIQVLLEKLKDVSADVSIAPNASPIDHRVSPRPRPTARALRPGLANH